MSTANSSSGTALTGISLFASSGIGDLALRALGIEVLVANELLATRAALFSANFADTTVLTGDVWDLRDAIVAAAQDRLAGRPLDVMLATPPCQGMSSNGLGKLLAEVRAGNRPAQDPRNRLVIPAIEIARRLRPRLIVFENVPGMARTAILDDGGAPVNILDFIARELGPEYVGGGQVVEFADYGVPQRRQRLITVFTRDPGLRAEYARRGSLLAAPTHAREPTLLQEPWTTVREVIGHYPPLDAIAGHNADADFDPMHQVPVLDPKKYEWIRHTPEGRSAFDNQCIRPDCGDQHNPVHGARRGDDGINKANEDTPLHCRSCGALLPRPYTVTAEGKRLMKGFVSAYKRMPWDAPAPTLTQNFVYPSSDHNLHPSQHRVLSLAEALALHTVSDFDYAWTTPSGDPVSKTLIRDSIGESVPPAGLRAVLAPAVAVLRGQKPASESA